MFSFKKKSFINDYNLSIKKKIHQAQELVIYLFFHKTVSYIDKGSKPAIMAPVVHLPKPPCLYPPGSVRLKLTKFSI